MRLELSSSTDVKLDSWSQSCRMICSKAAHWECLQDFLCGEAEVPAKKLHFGGKKVERAAKEGS